MTNRRYVVLDKNGVMVNTILINDPIPNGYWPGYGSYLVDVTGDGKSPTLGKTPPKLAILNVIPDKPFVYGDTINQTDGKVTKPVPKYDPDGARLQFSIDYSKLNVASKQDLSL